MSPGVLGREELSPELDIMESNGEEKEAHEEICQSQVLDVEGMDRIRFPEQQPTHDHEKVPNNPNQAHHPNTEIYIHNSGSEKRRKLICVITCGSIKGI
jgi:hypothetical protein